MAAASRPARAAPLPWQQRVFNMQHSARIFGLVGGAEWLFVARVSRQFREECLRSGGGRPRTDRLVSMLSLPRAVQMVTEAPYLLCEQDCGGEGRTHSEHMGRFNFDSAAVKQLWVLGLAGGSTQVLSFLERLGFWAAEKEPPCRSFDGAASLYDDDRGRLCSCALAAFYGQVGARAWLRSSAQPHDHPDLCISAAVAGARPHVIRAILESRGEASGPVRLTAWSVPALVFSIGQAAQARSLCELRARDACEALGLALRLQPGLLRQPLLWAQRHRGEAGSLNAQLQRGLELAVAGEAATPLVLALLRAAIDPKTGGSGLAKDLVGCVAVQAARARRCTLLEQIVALPVAPGFAEQYAARLWREWQASRAGFGQLQARYYWSSRSAPLASLQHEELSRHVLIYLVTKALETSAAGIREEVWDWLSPRAPLKDEHAASVQINMGDWESGWQMAKAGWPVSRQTVRDRLLPHIAVQRGRVDVFQWAAAEGALREAGGLGLVEAALDCPAVLDYLLGAEAAEAGLWGGLRGPTQQQWDAFWQEAPQQLGGAARRRLTHWLLQLGLEFDSRTGGRLEALEAFESLRRAGRKPEALWLAERQGLSLLSLSPCLRPWESGAGGCASGPAHGAAPPPAALGPEATRPCRAQPWRPCDSADCASCQHSRTFVAAFRSAAWLFLVEQEEEEKWQRFNSS